MATAPKPQSHNVRINTRYGETDRDCYCRATNGYSHHENEFPWLEESEARNEKPLDIPFRPGEDVEDYHARLIRAEAWEEGYLYRLRMFTAPEDLDAEVMLAALAGAQNPYKDTAEVPGQQAV